MSKPKLVCSAPVLLVADVQAAANYWRDCVGFEYDQLWGEPPSFAMCFRDDHGVMLNQVADTSLIVPHHTRVCKLWNAYFWVDDATTLFEELTQRGARIDYELCEQPYGCLEFGIQDLEGHDIAFGQGLVD